MSKVVILLFVVLVASVVDASSSMDRLLSVQARLESYFAIEIGKIEGKYNTTSLTMTENSRKLLEDAASIKLNVSQHKRAIWKKVKEDTLELIVKTLTTDGTEECYKMVNNIDFKGRVWLSNVYNCTEGILNIAFENVAEMKMMYELLHETLNDWRVRIGACAHYFDTAEEVENAIMCTETIETQTRPLFAESVPSVFAKIDETNNLLHTLLSSFDKCSKGYDAYQTEAADLTSRAKICYKQKMEEAARLLVIPLIMDSETTKAAPTTPQTTDEVGWN